MLTSLEWCLSMHNILLHSCLVIYLVSPLLLKICFQNSFTVNNVVTNSTFLLIFFPYLFTITLNGLKWFCVTTEGLIGDSGQIVKIFCSKARWFRHWGPCTFFVVYSFVFTNFSNCKIPFFSSWTLQKQSKDRMWSAGQFADPI